jgi:hypothetical protein
MSLTPQQKAALTRKYNKAREEKEALEAQESVKGKWLLFCLVSSDVGWLGPRNAKVSALDGQRKSPLLTRELLHFRAPCTSMAVGHWQEACGTRTFRISEAEDT